MRFQKVGSTFGETITYPSSLADKDSLEDLTANLSLWLCGSRLKTRRPAVVWYWGCLAMELGGPLTTVNDGMR